MVYTAEEEVVEGSLSVEDCSWSYLQSPENFVVQAGLHNNMTLSINHVHLA